MLDQFREFKIRHGYSSNFTLLLARKPRTFAEAFSRLLDMQNDKRESLQDVDAGQIQGKPD